MAYDEKVLFRINNYAPQLILTPQLRKMTQHHQIMCG